MSVATARAHVNIALAKYWGKRNAALNLPAVPSLSAGIEDLWTEAEVEFGPFAQDSLEIDGAPAEPGELDRVVRFFDLLRERAGTALRGRVRSHSHFPRAAGLASSASAFAALAMAGAAALDLGYGSAQLSALARRGSGSAARSVYGGYVEIGVSDEDDLAAVRVATAAHLPLDVAIVVASDQKKSVSSRRAMTSSAQTSPYYAAWVEGAPKAVVGIREALLARDFAALAERSERNCLAMHAVTFANDPPVVFFSGLTLQVVHCVRELRAGGVPAFFTIDAGPNVVVFFEPDARDAVAGALSKLGGTLRFSKVGGEPTLQ
jgi:diphosphomevalonate decarboxylase